MNDAVIVFSTCPSQAEAQEIASALVAQRLAACVQQLPGMISTYVWQGQAHNEVEVLLMIKSRLSLFPQVEAAIKKLHSYDVPEIVAVPMAALSKDYMAWIHESLI